MVPRRSSTLATVAMLASILAGFCSASALFGRRGPEQHPQCAMPDRCSPETCVAPDCACEDGEITVPLQERPQIVYLTFDDALTALADSTYYQKLFDGQFTNPDGCNIRATHFLSARSADYSLVNKYYNKGHEIASHGITHRSPPEYWKNLTKQGWADEIDGMRTMLHEYGSIPVEAIKGIRAPFLQGGGDVQFQMMEDLGFEYDCSMPSQLNGFLNMEYGRWPYTLDYYVSELHDNCQVSPCPICSHPGIWVQPMLDLEDNLEGPDGHGYPCAMLDSCQMTVQTADSVYEMLKKNFDRAYDGTTRAPFGLYLHAAWFFGYEWRFEGYLKFLEYITSKDDVWVVPVSAGIEYRKNPVTNADLMNGTSSLSDAFGCTNFPSTSCRRTVCRYENVLNEDIYGNEELITVCGTCPPNFPWLGNPLGK